MKQKIQEELSKFLFQSLGSKTLSLKPVYGGDINQSYLLQLDNQKQYFIKCNSTDYAYQMFKQEIKSLNKIAATNTIATPKVKNFFKIKSTSFLILEYKKLDTARNSNSFVKDFAINLANMHNNLSTNKKFGWDEDNYIGHTVQKNSFNNYWSEFFSTQRLEPQLQALGAPLLDIGLQLCQRINQFFDGYRIQPSLLHGDLWSGNYGYDIENRRAIIFDPASYYGDREADLAMTELFGRLPMEFYDCYNEYSPINNGYKIRKNLYNLYHILNHAQLFGGGYYKQAETLIKSLLSEVK